MSPLVLIPDFCRGRMLEIHPVRIENRDLKQEVMSGEDNDFNCFYDIIWCNKSLLALVILRKILF